MAGRAKKSAQRSANKKQATRPERKRSAASAADSFVAELRERGVERAKVGGFDVDGVLRGKYVSLRKLTSALKSGFGFCDVIFGWDVADALYDNAEVTGWSTGYPDAHAVLDPSSCRILPTEPDVAAILCDFRDPRGKPHPACTRSLLKRVLERLARHDLSAQVGVEFEFFFFRETRDSLAAKGYRDLQPLDPGMFGYSWLRSGQDQELMRHILDATTHFDLELEGLHTETGPGVYEAAIGYDDALRAADKAALFKVLLKQIASQHDLSVTFMAKWHADLPGCSGHIHQSLWRDGKNVFHDQRTKNGMSLLLKRFIAGQMELMQELTALYSPTINSYKRYVPGLWAPLVASWGVENRTCAVRVIAPTNPSAARVEYRQTAADINPYTAIAASLGAGLWGIEKQLELPPESIGDAGEGGPRALPRTLEAATARLAKSRAARQILGSEFVDHYVRTREWEVRQFQRAVTDWELRRYFEAM